MRRAPVLTVVVAAFALAAAATTVHATTMTTVNLNPSELGIQVTLSGNPVGGIGNLAVTGSAAIETNIDANGAGGPWTSGPGNGDFAIIASSFTVQDGSFVVDLGLGPTNTLLVELDGVGLSINSSGGTNGGVGIPVAGNEWNLDSIGAPDAMSMSLNQGQLIISGAILTLLGAANPTILDLEAAPVGVELADILTYGIGGTADNDSVSLVIPTIAIDVGEDLLGAGLLFAELSGDINLLVPEPSSVALLGAGLFGLVALRVRRIRKG